MLQELVRLTHSHQLWPVQTSRGTSANPAIDNIGRNSSAPGITSERFGKMKTVLAQCLKEISPSRLPQRRKRRSDLSSMSSQTLGNAKGIAAEELARKNKLPHSDEIEIIRPIPRPKPSSSGSQFAALTAIGFSPVANAVAKAARTFIRSLAELIPVAIGLIPWIALAALVYWIVRPAA